LAALLSDLLGKDEISQTEPAAFPGGAARRDRASDRAWVLIDDGSPHRFGPALAWAWQQQVRQLDVLVEGAEPAGVVARRAAELARPPLVRLVSGRSTTPAEAAGPGVPAGAGGDATEYVRLLRAHGVEPVFEHGVLRGEVLGLEVARLVDGRFEVGVGRHDRAARADLGDPVDLGHPVELGRALDGALAAVATRRRPGAARHPANALARARWLRSVVCAAPDLVGAAVLTLASPPLPSAGVTDNSAVPCVGTTATGRPVVVVCSTGIDLDLVPTAADSRRLHDPDAELVIVVPEGDDPPVTRALAAALRRPAAVRTVPRSWEQLGGKPAASPAFGP
jgi:hypothetical protein